MGKARGRRECAPDSPPPSLCGTGRSRRAAAAWALGRPKPALQAAPPAAWSITRWPARWRPSASSGTAAERGCRCSPAPLMPPAASAATMQHIGRHARAPGHLLAPAAASRRRQRAPPPASARLSERPCSRPLPRCTQLLEQRKLPLETEWLDIEGPQAAWTAIRDMTVRGAPAIGARRLPASADVLPRLHLAGCAAAAAAAAATACSRIWCASDGRLVVPGRGTIAPLACIFGPAGVPPRSSAAHPCCCCVPALCRAAIAAALSLAVDLVNGGGGAQFGSAAAAAAHVAEQMDYLVTR